MGRDGRLPIAGFAIRERGVPRLAQSLQSSRQCLLPQAHLELNEPGLTEINICQLLFVIRNQHPLEFR